MTRAVKRWVKLFWRGRKGTKELSGPQSFDQPPKWPTNRPISVISNTEYPLDFNPWVLETGYTLKATSLLKSIGSEVLTAYLTVLMLQQSGISATSTFIDEISFYVIRPRAAPFIGLLDLFKPRSQQGLAELIVDGMLSFVEGTNVARSFWGPVDKAPDNPTAPVSDLKILAVGAIMMCIPSFAVLAITFLTSTCMTSNSDGEERKRDSDASCVSMIAGLCLWVFWLLSIAAFICILPLVALIEMAAAIVVTIHRKVKKGQNKAKGISDGDSRDSPPRKSFWMAPLTTSSGIFCALYWLFLLSSFVINVGNWLFFVNYLKIEGEVYCPTNFTQIIAIWILVPFGIDLFFYAFRAWTKDTYLDTDPKQVLGHETPPL